LNGAKIAFLKTSLWSKAGPGTRDAWAKGQEILSKHGAQIEEIELPEDFGRIPDWQINILSGEGRVSFLGSKYSFINSPIFFVLSIYLIYFMNLF
jgi:amidase